MVDACAHKDKLLVWSMIGSSGYPLLQRQLRWQCQSCGCLLSNAVSHSLARPDTPDVNMEILTGFLDSGQRYAQNAIDQKAARARYTAELKERYAEYLESPEWRDKRRLVMFRAAGICEGCRLKPATQVHHLTYQNIGEEFLWQLVAVCRDCHERYHEIG